MADEIHVGSVAVSVVPDLRGFNDTMRRELVPSANDIGQEIGKEMSRGIIDSLDIGSAVLDSARRGVADIVSAGEFTGTEFADAFKAKLDAELRGYKPDVTVDVTANTLRAREEIDRLAKDITVKVRTTGGGGGGGDGGSGLGSGISGVGGVAGGGGEAAGGGILAGVPLVGALPPQAQIAAIAAAIAALPLIAQAAAGTITFALGGALAAVGIYGAILTGKLTAQWDLFTANAKKDIEKIGVAFVPVLQNILAMAGIVLDEMTPVFVAAEKAIAGPFQAFADAIISSFASPAVKASIQAVAGAFVDLLNAVTPQIASDMTLIAQSITNMAKAVAANPKAFADFARFLVLIVVGAFDLIAGLTIAANWIETHWTNAWQRMGININAVWRGVIDTIGLSINIIINIVRLFFDVLSGNWSEAFKDITNIGRNFWNQMLLMYHTFLPALGQFTATWLNRINGLWNEMWLGLVVLGEWGRHEVAGQFDLMRNDIATIFSDSIHWLEQAGKDIIAGLLNGIKIAMADISNWVNSNVVQPIVHWIEHHFGISSPSTVMAAIGSNLVQGLLRGMFTSGKDLTHFITNVFGGLPQALGSFISRGLVDISKIPSKVLSTLGSAFKSVGGFFAHLFGGGGGSGVSQWAGTVAQALGMLGLPLSLGGQVLYQMQTESGGNANAINLTDINAAMGDPSRGLMQVIGSTFAAYHVPGTSSNIYDPLANIAAALNYAMHVYGPTLMRGGMGIGSGHGYDEGGWLPTGLSLARNLTGSPELVVPQSQLQRYASLSMAAMAATGAGGPTYIANFDGLTGQAIEGHVRTAFQTMSLTDGHVSRLGRRS